jgi:hypothetical protein
MNGSLTWEGSFRHCGITPASELGRPTRQETRSQGGREISQTEADFKGAISKTGVSRHSPKGQSTIAPIIYGIVCRLLRV